MVNLGTIEQVDLKQVWPHEARDFTPWLADNLDNLGEALGLRLKLKGTEVPVGPFYLDILAREMDLDKPVIIENQLEVTDHTHLSQLLTYAAGFDAYAIVWVTRDFRDEHRKALDWLNDRTDEDTQFFGVAVEAWQIDGSRAAPHFRVVVAPNAWSKGRVKRSGRVGSEVSERGEAYRSFYQNVVDVIRNDHQFTNRTVGAPRAWMSFASGFPGIQYNPCFVFRRNIVRVEVHISTGQREENKRLFDALFERKDSIEIQLTGEGWWEWERLDDGSACRISIVREGRIDDSSEILERTKQWIVDRLLAFKRVFGPHLAELVE